MRRLIHLFTFACLLLTLGWSGCAPRKPWADPEAIESMSDAKFQRMLARMASDTAVLDFGGTLSTSGCRADLAILKRVLEEAQTSLYRYARKAGIDRLFADADQRLSEQAEYLGVVRAVRAIQTKIACGHSGWGHNPDFQSYRDQHMRFFPLDIRIRAGRWFVLRNCARDADLPPGTEILRINGLSVTELTPKLRAFMYRDGHSDSLGVIDIERYFPNAYSNFIDNPDTFALEVRPANAGRWGPTQTIAVLPLPRQEIRQLRKARYPQPPNRPTKPLQFEMRTPDRTGIYRIASFNNGAIAHLGQDFEAFTDSVFEILRQQATHNLVIDLRDNTGGWTGNGKYLFEYLITEKMPYIARVECRKYRDFSFEPLISHRPGYLDTFDLQLIQPDRYEWINYPSKTAVPATKNHFAGQVYVLTDGYTRSCGAVFSALLRARTAAIFVGEETGSAQCGPSGMVMGIRLPYTGLNVHFSTARYINAVPDPDNTRGVVPDFPVPHRTEADDAKDPGMDKVLELIRAGDRK